MLNILSRFQLRGAPQTCEPYGSGHINQTYLVVTDAPHRYILQRINHRVFTDVPALMENIDAVTRYLAQQDPDPRHVLTLVPTLEGAPYCMDENGESWRIYEFIQGGICLNRAESADDFYQSAVAFGRFQRMLAHFPAQTLHETIAHFHDTPSRFRALHAAADADAVNRRREVEPELAFALAHEEEAAGMMRLLAEGKLPLRVTHNDTKLNNVILDAKDRTPLCVIDLDTVMPGLVANDFGDSIRFGASTAAEDEKNLDSVALSLPMYETYVKGFLGVCGEHLTALEIETLPMGAKMMSLENGVRFLTDYLQGDVYYAIHRPEHNLDRCRTQFRLVADMETKWAEMNAIVARHAARP
ncbi:MAG TPA: aminoglycoside phosphotransferase family protein [Candidatus Limiplasma sp.]|nr:aminoglycoside phosphotransferase family protein [Candidatus Limiplasma sp.]HPS81525.1 aminoglycoside phosphotransferase family protein [Candidatus Limiplasma sp.]